MGTNSGYGKISTSGLTLMYDAGEIKNSFKGKPTTNYVPDASTMPGWTSYGEGNDGTFITEFGTTGYKMYNRGSWNGLYRGISLPSTGTYTISAYFRYLGGATNNNGGVVYTSGGGISDTAAGHGKTIGEWVRVSMTRTYTTTSITFYLISYGGTYGGDYSSWEVTMPQVELGSLTTPFVDGSRSTTQSLIDISGNSTLELMNNPFDSNGDLNFDGTNTHIQVSQDVLSTNSPYTLVTIMRPTDLANNEYSFPQYNTYPDGFWHHVSSDGSTILWRHRSTSGSFGGHGMSNDTWGMHSLTWDGTTLKLYSNGVLVDSTTSAAGYNNNGSGKARIGMLSQRSSGYDYNYNGRIPVNMVYNRAITQSEMFDIYEHFRPRYSLPVIKDGSTAALAAPNAQHLYNLGIRARGTYWIKPTSYGGSAQEIYCDFDSNGGWMLVASNNASDGTIPGGTARNNSGYYLNRSGAIGTSNPNGDFIIGSMIDNLEFSKVRIIGWGFASINGTYTFPSNLGTYVTAEWNLTTTGSSRYTEKVARANVTIGGNGTIAPAANYFVLDAVRNNVGFNANQNQSTIGGAGVQSASGDPWEGCYLGHGISEGSYEGWYNTNSSANDSQGYTTWVR
jgi:hypothetical protein